MGILSASKPHCHFRLSKSIFKILPIYRKNILGKQHSQALSSKYVFRLLYAPKFLFSKFLNFSNFFKISIFSTKLNMIVKVVKIFAVVL